MADVANLRVKFGIDGVGDVERGAQRVEKSVNSVVGGVARTAAGFVLGGLVNQVGAAVAGVGKAVLGFDENMANVNSIAQLTGAQLGNLKDDVVSLAMDPAIRDGPAALADGLYQINSSGFAGAEALKILDSSSRAASAGVTSTSVAATAATAVLNAYGMGAEDVNHVNDVMFQTVNDGVITYEQLATNMGNVIPIASSLGISIEEVGAAYAQMTLKGVNASAAETQISALMRSAINPTDALTAAVQKHGYASATAAIESEGLAGFLKIVDEEAGGNQETMMDMLGTQEAMNAATILGKDGAKAYSAEVIKMNKSSQGLGATQRALNKQMEAVNYQIGLIKKNVQLGAVIAFDLLGGSVSGVVGKVADLTTTGVTFLHYLDHVTEGGSRATKSLSLLPPEIQRFARGAAIAVDAVGDLVRAFQNGGLDEFVSEFTRIQGDRLWSGLETMGQEAWGAFSGAVASAASAGLKLGVVAVRVAGWVLSEGIPDLWGWFLSQVGLGGNSTASMDGPGDGSYSLAGHDPINLGDVVVAAGLKLAGFAKDWAGNLWGFVQDQLGFGSGADSPLAGIPVLGGAAPAPEGLPFGDVVINAGLALAGTAKDWAGDLWGWVQNNLSTTEAIGLAATGIALGPIPVIGYLLLGDQLKAAAGNLWGWVENQLGIGNGTGSDPAMDGQLGGGASAAHTITLGDIAVNVEDWAKGVFAPVSTFVEDTINAVKGSVHLSNYTLSLDAPAVGDVSVDLKGLYDSVAQSIIAQPITFDQSTFASSGDWGGRFGDAVGSFIGSLLTTELSTSNGGGYAGVGAGSGTTAPENLAQKYGVDQVVGQFLGEFFKGVNDEVTNQVFEYLTGGDAFQAMKTSRDQGDSSKAYVQFWQGIWDNIVKPFFSFDDFEIKKDSPLGKTVDFTADVVSGFGEFFGKVFSADTGQEVLGSIEDLLLGSGSFIGDISSGISDLWNRAFDMLFGSEGTPWTPEGGASSVTPDFSGIFGDMDIEQALKDALTFDLSGVGIPSLPDWMSDTSWITDKIALLRSAWEEVIKFKTWLQGSDNGPDGGDGTVHGGYNRPEMNDPSNVSNSMIDFTLTVNTDVQYSYEGQNYSSLGAVLDARNLKDSFNREMGGETSEKNLTVKTIFEADTSPVALAYTDVMSWGTIWKSSTFTGQFMSNIDDVVLDYTTAYGLGATWDAAAFTADININDNASGPLATITNLINGLPTSKTISVSTDYSSTGTPPPVAPVKRATGGTVREPVTLVGERGPELVSLPYGSNVHTAGQTSRMLQQSGQPVTVNVYLQGTVVGVNELKTEVERGVAQGMISAHQRRLTGQGMN